jgi:hypothetical protein
MPLFQWSSCAKLVALNTVIFVVVSCGTTASFLDTALPDRYGLGSAFTTGNYSGRQVGQTGGDAFRETGSYKLDSIVTWLEWDIPSVDSAPVSVRGVREQVANDYRDWRTPTSDSLVSLTRRTTVDELTGEVEQSWGFGLSEAVSSAVLGLLSYAGFRLFKSRSSGLLSAADGEAE